ncbi:hypothetical protein BO71DRAFT_315861, partial [Aspergillus ellipticus CBS 707.79]
MEAPPGFPMFNDGDVRIHIQPDVFQLHSFMLSGCSRALGRLVGPYYAMGPLPHLQGLNHLGIREINLVGSAAHKYGVFQIREPNNVGNDATGFFNLGVFPAWPSKTRQCWRNIFKIVYNIEPDLRDIHGNLLLLEQSNKLIELAEDIEATGVVFPALDKALLGYDQELFHRIANDPIGWVKLGTRIRSVDIFHESIVHMVGRWNCLTEEGYRAMPEYIRGLCMGKQVDLDTRKKAIDAQILNYRFGVPQAPRIRDVYSWMALAVYRQWMGQSITEGLNHYALDGGAMFYRALNVSGTAYMESIDETLAHMLAPIDEAEVHIITARLTELKNDIKQFVGELLINRSRYDPGTWGELPYLTCCKLYYEDFPWFVAPGSHPELS